jgi:hypothetical protein
MRSLIMSPKTQRKYVDAQELEDREMYQIAADLFVSTPRPMCHFILKSSVSSPNEDLHVEETDILHVVHSHQCRTLRSNQTNK